jgi:hypothetical protein
VQSGVKSALRSPHPLFRLGRTYNLGQIEGIISNGVEDQILQPVDDVEELLAQRRHCAGLYVLFFAPDGSGLLSSSQTTPRGSAVYAASRVRCMSVSWSADGSAYFIVADGGFSWVREARDGSAFAAAQSSPLKVPRFIRHVHQGISISTTQPHTGHSHVSLILDLNVHAVCIKERYCQHMEQAHPCSCLTSTRLSQP